MRFPSGDKGRVRGFDGHLQSGSEGFNVPLGESSWEFGTDADYKSKANSEFEKRTKQVSAAEQADATFVFVSPWTWDSSNPRNKLEDWVAIRKKSSRWKDVRYIDGSALETWLDHCPAVAAWHARDTFGVRPPEGVRSTEEFWRDFAGQFGPELTEEVILCGREASAQQLLADLMRPSNMVQLAADSPDRGSGVCRRGDQKGRPGSQTASRSSNPGRRSAGGWSATATSRQTGAPATKRRNPVTGATVPDRSPGSPRPQAKRSGHGCDSSSTRGPGNGLRDEDDGLRGEPSPNACARLRAELEGVGASYTWRNVRGATLAKGGLRPSARDSCGGMGLLRTSWIDQS